MSDMDEFKLTEEEESPKPEGEGGGGSNRTFAVVAGILGGIFLLTLIGLAVFALVILPQNRAQRANQSAAISTQNAQIAATVTESARAAAAARAATDTAQKAPPAATATLRPTNTPVIAMATNTPGSLDPRTATVSALFTQAAQAQLTTTVMGTSTGLPSTGFAEDIGIPGLLGMAVLLVAVIFLARRLRMSNAG